MRNRSLLCLGLLAAVIAVLLHEALFLGKALVPADGIFLFPPWRTGHGFVPSNYLLADWFLDHHVALKLLHERVLGGSLPLWNPLICCGVPFIASMQTAALFPVHILLAPFDPFHASGVAAFLKLFLAGSFMFFYLRSLDAGRSAALLSGIAFALCGWMIVWLGSPHVNCAMWLPLLFLLLETGLADARRWSLFALAFGFMCLGGHPPTIVHVFLAVSAYALFRALSGRRERRARDLLLFSAGIAAGLLVAAPQLLPFLEYYGQSSSAASSAALQRWAMRLPPGALLGFFLPHLGGAPHIGGEFLGLSLGFAKANFNERTLYVGVLPLLLAAAAALGRRDGATRFHAALAALSLTAVFGLLPWSRLFAFVPVLDKTSPTRLILLADFSLCALAGLGLDRVLRGRRPAWLKPLALVSGAAVLIVVLVGIRLVRGQLGLPGVAFFVLTSALVPLGGALVLLGCAFGRPAPAARWGKAVCLLWTAFELLRLGTGYNPAVSRSEYYPQTPAIRLLLRDAGVHRILGLGGVLPPDTAAIFGLQDARGMDFMTVRRYEELVTGGAGEFFFYTTARRPPPVLDLLDVKYILAPRGSGPYPYTRVYSGEVDVYLRRGRAGRALVVRDYEVVADKSERLRRLRSPGFDPGKVLLLEDDPGVPHAPSGPAGTARMLRYGGEEVALSVETDAPAFVLLLDTWFPGWKATVNGEPAELLRADHAFRAVRVPSGTSSVRMTYRPASFRLGLALSLATLFLLSMLCWKNKR